MARLAKEVCLQCVVASAVSKRMTSSTQGFLKRVGQAVSVIFVVMKGIAIANMGEAYAFKRDCRHRLYGRSKEYCCVGYSTMVRLRLHHPHSSPIALLNAPKVQEHT